VAIDEAVFLRSLFGEGKVGGWTVSLGVAFRDSQEKGLVSFLVGGGGAGRLEGAGGAVGGAPHGTEGRTPDSPCNDGFIFRGGGGGGVFSADH
jgi:hypothetical protein